MHISIIMPMHMHMYIISRAIRKPFAMVRGLPSARAEEGGAFFLWID